MHPIRSIMCSDERKTSVQTFDGWIHLINTRGVNSDAIRQQLKGNYYKNTCFDIYSQINSKTPKGGKPV